MSHRWISTFIHMDSCKSVVPGLKKLPGRPSDFFQAGSYIDMQLSHGKPKSSHLCTDRSLGLGKYAASRVAKSSYSPIKTPQQFNCLKYNIWRHTCSYMHMINNKIISAFRYGWMINNIYSLRCLYIYWCINVKYKKKTS